MTTSRQYLSGESLKSSINITELSKQIGKNSLKKTIYSRMKILNKGELPNKIYENIYAQLCNS